jgi:hypothetical protein
VSAVARGVIHKLSHDLDAIGGNLMIKNDMPPDTLLAIAGANGATVTTLERVGR